MNYRQLLLSFVPFGVVLLVAAAAAAIEFHSSEKSLCCHDIHYALQKKWSAYLTSGAALYSAIFIVTIQYK